MSQQVFISDDSDPLFLRRISVIRVSLPVLLVLAIACSESGTLAEFGPDSTSRQADFAELRSALASIGCRDTKPGDAPAMLTVAGPDGAPANFACPNSAQGTSHCHSEMPRTDTLEVNGVIVGFVHTHPMRDGEVFDCPDTETENEVANNEARGGGSETDWQGVWDRNLPTFTVDADRMWRLDPSQVANRVNNPHRWMRPQSGGCAARAAL